MKDQPEALKLADFCEGNVLYQPAAAELRRLHTQRDALVEALKFYADAGTELGRLVDQRNQLLEALRLIAGLITNQEAKQKALEAIAKVEGQQ